jgi:arylsulfatase A
MLPVLSRRQMLTCLAASVLPLGAEPAAVRPSIILILADDLGFGDVSFQNPGSPLHTPHINALASAGLAYEDAHSPASVCTPTRYGILTGRYAWRTWLHRGALRSYGSSLIEHDRMTMPKLLKQRGYVTACVGKWHLGIDWQHKNPVPRSSKQRSWPEEIIALDKPIVYGPLDVGFDSFFGIDAPNYPPYAFIRDDRVVGPEPSIRRRPALYEVSGLMQPGWNVSNVFSTLRKSALKKLRGLVQTRKPYFLYLPLTAPHVPIAPSPRFRGRSPLGPYGDYVLEIDAFVGDVVRLLRSAGALEDTLIIFTSDNGSPAIYDNDSAHGSLTELTGFHPNGDWQALRPDGVWQGLKGGLREGGHRVPLVLHWPSQIPPGSTTGRTICLTDLFATIAEIVGAKIGDTVAEDSLSMVPDWQPRSSPRPTRVGIVHHSYHGVFAVRVGDWKFIEGRPSDGLPSLHCGAPWGVKLYNLASDVREQRNLACERPSTVAELWGVLNTIRRTGRSVVR